MFNQNEIIMSTRNLQNKRAVNTRIKTEVLPDGRYSTLTWLLILIMMISFTFLSAGNPRQKDTSHWRNPTAEIKQVFTCDSKLKNPEILKLYTDNSYEFLVYQKGRNRSEMRRETGTYTLKGKTLMLKRDGKPKVYSPRYKNTYFISDNGKLYASLWDKFVNKDQSLLTLNTEPNYLQPFYIDPLNGTIVTNKEAPAKIDLEDLVKNLTRYAKNEEEKVNILVNFIINSISYDYAKADGKTSPVKDGSIKGMLAGRVRMGVCGDYAIMTKTLMKMANIEAEYIHGSARNSFNQIQLKIPDNHAWNTITVNGEKRLYDVCWSDCVNGGWLNVKPSIMIRTHFPANKADQLLENPITEAEFNYQPYIYASSSQEIENYYPKNAINHVDETFTMTYDKIIKDVKVRSVDTSLFEIVYSEEGGNGKKIYRSTQIDNFILSHQDGKTTITVPVKNRVNGLIFDFGEAEFGYKVIRSSKTDDFKYAVSSVNRNHVDSYFRAVFSAVFLSDIPKLKELVGEKNPVFFNQKGKLTLSKDLLDKFRTWDGLMTCLQIRNNFESVNGKLECTSTTRSIEMFGKEFQIELNEEGYQIVAMK